MNKLLILIIAMFAMTAVFAEEQIPAETETQEATESSDSSAGEEIAVEDAEDSSDEEDSDANEEAELDDSEEDAEQEDAAEEDVASDDSQEEDESEESSDDEDEEDEDESPESSDSEQDDVESDDSEDSEDSEDADESDVEDERRRRRLIPHGGGGRGPRPGKGDQVNAWMEEVMNACPSLKASSKSCKELLSSTACPSTIKAFATIAAAKKACPFNKIVDQIYKLAKQSPFSKCKYDCKSTMLKPAESIQPAAYQKKIKPLAEKFKPKNGQFALEDSDEDSDMDLWNYLYETRDQEVEEVKDEDMGGGGWWCCWGWC
eukprot:TRINITY_DN257_c0_g2_i3.p1 TRINITY_DN257_c0_g2~~TRINITY_DN257_c0_g2_i3.p1  ORF type:complete len:318 (-),score=136.70 TRINITY_DN257_c0_g2_i3:106-1059(-)